MTPVWDDVNARSRGLGAHLLGRARLEALASVRTLAELAAALDREGQGVGRAGGGRTASAIERSVRRDARRHLALLARWCGARGRFLAFLFEDEDRRSLRALLRGAIEGVSPERRLSGLLPSPALPERALEELAGLSTASEISATLTAWGNPYGEAIRAEAAKAHVDVFRIELEINHFFAARARRAARWGGRDIRAVVRESLDLENAVAAIVLCRHAADVEPGTCFLEGGRLLDGERFREIVRSRDLGLLAAAFRPTPFANVFREVEGDVAAVERALLRRRLEVWVARARTEPLSVAPLLAFVLRLRAQGIDVRTIAWSLALGAPRTAAELVSV